MKILDPKIRVDRLSMIPLNKLRSEGFKGILIDLDNTLVPWRKNHISEETSAFVQEAKTMGFHICLFSNALSDRALSISQTLDIQCKPEARKPFKKNFKIVIEAMGIKPEETLVIGDQIFTDILGGNFAECYTILLPPLDDREFIGTKCLRLLEKLCGYHQTAK